MRNYALLEMVDAAVRSDRLEIAIDATRELVSREPPAGTPLGRGIAARCRALIDEGPNTQSLFKESISHLEESQDVMESARAHLFYGEWLRRANRRANAREQLRIA